MNNDVLQLKAFLNKYNTAKAANSKEIRFTVEEAEHISSAISTLLANQLLQANQIIDLQQQIMSAEVRQDGGKF